MPMVGNTVTNWRCLYCGYQTTNRRRTTEKPTCPACGEGTRKHYSQHITDQFVDREDRPHPWERHGDYDG